MLNEMFITKNFWLEIDNFLERCEKKEDALGETSSV